MGLVYPDSAAVGAVLSSLIEFVPRFLTWLSEVLGLPFSFELFDKWSQRQKVGFWLVLSLSISIGLFVSGNPGLDWKTVDFVSLVGQLGASALSAFVGSQLWHLGFNTPVNKALE